MRYILIFWALPMSIFWGWYYLSYHDMHFGYLFLSRLMHDFAFQTYGNLLGVDPASIPPLVLRACVVDTAIIFAILGYRRRREIRRWWEARRAVSLPAAPLAGPVHPAE